MNPAPPEMKTFMTLRQTPGRVSPQSTLSPAEPKLILSTATWAADSVHLSLWQKTSRFPGGFRYGKKPTSSVCFSRHLRTKVYKPRKRQLAGGVNPCAQRVLPVADPGYASCRRTRAGYPCAMEKSDMQVFAQASAAVLGHPSVVQRGSSPPGSSPLCAPDSYCYTGERGSPCEQPAKVRTCAR